MGNFLSNLLDLFNVFSESDPARIVMLGLDAAGKSTILYKVKLNENVCTIPTIGFNVETVSPAKGVTFTVWDVAGQGKIRRMWHHYLKNTKGLLFVVDSNDRERISEAKEELYGVLDNDEMRNVPVVIMANKQDLPNAMSLSEITELLEMYKITNRKWSVQGTCAPTGKGVFESMLEMAKMIKEGKNHGH